MLDVAHWNEDKITLDNWPHKPLGRPLRVKGWAWCDIWVLSPYNLLSKTMDKESSLIFHVSLRSIGVWRLRLCVNYHVRLFCKSRESSLRFRWCAVNLSLVNGHILLRAGARWSLSIKVHLLCATALLTSHRTIDGAKPSWRVKEGMMQTSSTHKMGTGDEAFVSSSTTNSQTGWKFDNVNV